MPDAGRVSAVVVSWNSGDALLRCVRSLVDQADEVIVVDNASADGSADRVGRELGEASVVRLSRNAGFAGAVNRGVRKASHDFVLLLNPDAEALPGAVDALASCLRSRDDLAAAAGRLVNADGSWQRGFNVRRLPTLASLAVELLLLDHVWPGNPITRRARALDMDPDLPGDVEQPAAACLMVRRSAFEAVGGMDEVYWPAWFEDVDLCHRWRDAGWRLAYEPRARFVHEGGSSTRALGPSAFARVFHRNLHRYVRRHHGPIGRAVVRLAVIVGMAVRSVAGSRGQRAGARAVLLDACRGWPSARSK
ncbi:MAG: glycosyltransferase family 2 protein [Vicinamibacterales bacterium]